MSVIYTLTNVEDQQILFVSQDTNYKLYHSKSYGEELSSEGFIASGLTQILSTPVDGKYRLNLENISSSEIANEEFYAYENLVSSIVADVGDIVCDTCSECGIDTDYNSAFLPSKLHAFEGLVMPSYGDTYNLDFVFYKQAASDFYSTRLNEYVETIVNTERIYGRVISGNELMMTYAAIYWAAMYYVEEASTPSSSIDYLKEKFDYNNIAGCLAKKGILVTDLKMLYDGSIVPVLKLFNSFQFDSPSDSDPLLITDEFLATNGEVYLEEELLEGRDINAPYIFGRIGFAIDTVVQNEYSIQNELGLDVTASFDYNYDTETERETYISKSAVVSGTYYFKFIKA